MPASQDTIRRDINRGAGMDKGIIWYVSKHRESRLPEGFFSWVRNRMLIISAVLLTGFGVYRFFWGRAASVPGDLIDPVSLIFMAAAIPFIMLTNIVWFFETIYLIKLVPLRAAVFVNFILGAGLTALTWYGWRRFGVDTLVSRGIWFGLYTVLYAAVLWFLFGQAWLQRRRRARA